MKQLSTELLKMKHARLVAETAMYTAIANRETSMGVAVWLGRKNGRNSGKCRND